MSDKIEPGVTWRERAGRLVLDPEDPRGDPIATPADRRWLWLAQATLAVSATNDPLRQFAADLRCYLVETCDHHYLTHGGPGMPEEDDLPHKQCLWCSEIVFEGDAANQVARVILGMPDEGGGAQ